MPVFYDQPAEDYHALEAASASLLYDIVGPEGCLAQAKFNSAWLNPDFVPVRDETMENGTLIHAALLEPATLAQRISIIDARDWRTKEARALRDDAYANGLIPILAEREPGSKGPSFAKIMEIKKALEASDAAELLFGEEGQNEVSYTWDTWVPFSLTRRITDKRVPCKARVDRLRPPWLIDLKSAPTASPRGFQNSCVAWGHHMRAAFYVDGWREQDESEAQKTWDYLFIVVQKEAPYITSVYRLDQRALEWGRLLYRKALSDLQQALASDHWPGFMRENIETIGLPTYAEHQLADREALGEL